MAVADDVEFAQPPMPSDSPRCIAASDDALLVRFGTEISLALHHRVRALTESLQSAALQGVRNLHPAYASLLIRYDPLVTDPVALESAVRGLFTAEPSERSEPSRIESRMVEIPVRFGGESGPDLGAVAAHSGLSPDEVVARYCAPLYRVYFLGFAPGFPYLGGLDAALAMPRLAVPRPRVAVGSVAIGGAQAGVYPAATPGGWRLIGRTSLRLFDAARAAPALLAMGDQVRFVAMGEGS